MMICKDPYEVVKTLMLLPPILNGMSLDIRAHGEACLFFDGRKHRALREMLISFGRTSLCSNGWVV